MNNQYIQYLFCLLFLISHTSKLTTQNLIQSHSSNIAYNIVKDLFIFNNGDIVAVGKGYSIQKVSGGKYEMAFSLPNKDSFNRVYFQNNITGYVCGDNGALMKTTSGGKSWFVLFSKTNLILNDINFINNNTGYVCGDSGLLIRTTNRGIDWESIKISKTLPNFKQIIIDDFGKGILISSEYLFYLTSDSGRTWIYKQLEVNLKIKKILKLKDKTIHLLCNDSNSVFIYETNDYGINWKKSAIFNSNTYVSYINSNSKKIIVSENDLLSISNNSGVSWNQYPLFNFHKVNNIIVINNLFVVIAKNKSIVFKNLKNYQEFNNEKYFNSNLTDYSIVNDSCIFLTTSNGSVLKYNFNSTNLDSMFSTNIYLSSIKFISKNVGFISGGNNVEGLILKSQNKGLSWEKCFTLPKNFFQKITFIGLDTGFVITTTGKLYITTNSGGNWNVILKDTTYKFYNISFKDNRIGFIAANLGTIIKTTNRGQNWEVVHKDYAGNFISISYSLNYFYALLKSQNNKYYLYRSTNEGLNWVSREINVDISLKNFEILNDSDIIAYGENGSIIRSTNYGISWFFIDLQTTSNINNSFNYRNNLYFIGNNGCILKYNKLNVNVNLSKNTIPTYIDEIRNNPNPFSSITNVFFQITFPDIYSMVLENKNSNIVDTLFIQEYLKVGNFVTTMEINPMLEKGLYKILLYSGKKKQSTKIFYYPK